MDRHYQVRYHDKSLGETYGVVDSFGEEAEKHAKQGNLVVSHAIYPTRALVPENSVKDIPLTFGGEYDAYVTLMADLHEVIEGRLGREKLQPGHLFAMGVGDGSARIACRSWKRNCPARLPISARPTSGRRRTLMRCSHR